jgi:flavin reductase (DIM6/NTAB) family NADH-FMN oxidoreductase RutF
MKKFTPLYKYDAEMAKFDYDEISFDKCVRFIDKRYPAQCKTWWPSFFPAAIGFLTSGTLDDPNIMTISSMAVMCRDPLLIGMPIYWDAKIKSGRYSMELINKNKEFCCCIPFISNEMTFACQVCGTYSGRDKNINKFQEAKLTPLPSKKISSPIIKECPLNIECTLKDKIALGCHTWIIGTVEAIHLNKDIVDAGAYLFWKSLPEYIKKNSV